MGVGGSGSGEGREGGGGEAEGDNGKRLLEFEREKMRLQSADHLTVIVGPDVGDTLDSIIGSSWGAESGKRTERLIDCGC